MRSWDFVHTDDIDALSQELTSESDAERRAAIIAHLGEVSQDAPSPDVAQQVFGIFYDTMNDPSPQVRARLIEAIEIWHRGIWMWAGANAAQEVTGEVRNLLARLMQDASPFVRERAAVANDLITSENTSLGFPLWEAERTGTGPLSSSAKNGASAGARPITRPLVPLPDVPGLAEPVVPALLAPEAPAVSAPPAAAPALAAKAQTRPLPALPMTTRPAPSKPAPRVDTRYRPPLSEKVRDAIAPLFNGVVRRLPSDVWLSRLVGILAVVVFIIVLARLFPQTTAQITALADVDTYTQPQATATAPPQFLLGTVCKVVGITDLANLNIRAAPGTSTPRIGAIPPNATGIIVVGQQVPADGAYWVPVRYQTLIGWVQQQYLAEQGSP